MTPETEDRELDRAEALIESWTGILQAQIQDAREAGRPDAEIQALQQSMYAAARESKGLARLTADEVRAAGGRYGELVTAHRAKAAHG